LASIIMLLGCANVQAQSLKDILSGVVDNVIGGVTNNKSALVGTWKYSSPDCEFESDNLLAKAGGSIATSKINKKLKTIYNKVGLTDVQITFNSDSTFTSKIKSKTVKGTYSYNSDAKTVTMKTSSGGSLTVHTSVSGSTLKLLFEASKLMSGIKTITSLASSVNSTASLINSVIGNYDGMKLGFKLKKQ